MVASTNNVAAPAATKKTESEIDRDRIRGGPNPWGAESVEAEPAGGESVGPNPLFFFWSPALAYAGAGGSLLPTPVAGGEVHCFFLVPCNGLCQCGWAAICCRVQHMAACPHRSCTIHLRHANALALAGLASRGKLLVWGV